MEIDELDKKLRDVGESKFGSYYTIGGTHVKNFFWT
jgi:hypothetical protein